MTFPPLHDSRDLESSKDQFGHIGQLDNSICTQVRQWQCDLNLQTPSLLKYQYTYISSFIYCSFNCCIGDLTQQGFNRKMAKLEEKYASSEASSQQINPCNVADSLATSTTIRQEVRWLYGRSSYEGQSTRSSHAAFNLSALSSKSLKQSSKERSKRLTKNRVVAVCIPAGQFTVPKRKKRDQLISGGFVKEFVVDEDESEEDLQAKLNILFPGHTAFVFLSVLRSQELIPATLPDNTSGVDLLTLVTNGSLYVRPKALQSPPNKSSTSVSPLHLPTSAVPSVQAYPPSLPLQSTHPLSLKSQVHPTQPPAPSVQAHPPSLPLQSTHPPSLKSQVHPT